jgi:hypothetical protein
MIKKEIIINADISKVWSIFCKIEDWPDFCSYISKAYWTTETKWTLDSSFTQIINILPVSKNVSKIRFIEIVPDKKVTWTGTRKLIRGVHTFRFEVINNKTKVINEEYFEGILAPIIFPFIKGRFNYYFEDFLRGLKSKVEKCV